MDKILGNSLVVQWLGLCTSTAEGLGSVSGGKTKIYQVLTILRDFPGSSVVKNPPANVGDVGDSGSIPGSGRSPGGGNGTPLQYTCLENPMDRGAWRTAVHRVTKSRTPLNEYAHPYHIKVGTVPDQEIQQEVDSVGQPLEGK